jgi:hypothetical protein
VKIEPKAFIAIEKTMAASMAAVWDKLARKIMHPVLEAGKWQEAHGLADKLTMKGVVTEVRPKLEEAAVSALLFGAHHVHGSVRATSFAKGRQLPQEIQGAIHLLVESVENDGADAVRNQLQRLITKLQQADATSHFQKDDVSDADLAQDGGLMEPQQGGKRKKLKRVLREQADHQEEVLKADSLAKQLNDAVLNGGRVAIDLAANLTTSRLISLGFLAEALDAGVTTYQVNEVLDERTCPVCQYMNGKAFDVAQEHSRLIQALNTSDPQELKSISPWPGQSEGDLSELYGMSLEELQAAGYGSPPYHPGCRGMLHLAGTVDEDIPLGGPGLADLLPEAEAAAEEDAVAEHAPGTDWTPEDIEQLKWERFEVTDPKMLKEINAAIGSEDYDTAQELIDNWKGAHLQKEDLENSDGPNAPREKRKPKQRAGLETDYDDIKPDSSSIAFDAGTQNDNLAPLDRS